MSFLEAVKTVFYGERFEPADAVQRNLLERIATLPKLTGILPYLGWMGDEGMYVLDQGGGALPDFPKPAMDNGMAKVLDVKQVPYVALGNIKDRRLIPLGSGVLSVQDMVERIYILTQTQPGDLY